MASKRRLHFKDLDFLRFLAFVPVSLYMIFFMLNSDNTGIVTDLSIIFSYIKLGSYDFFFFLSAFLITSHGLREYKYQQNFRLRNYYLRRSIRILPVLIPGILFAFLIHPWILKALKLTRVDMPSMINDLVFFGKGNSFLSPEQFLLFSVIWIIIILIIYNVFLGFALKILKDKLIYIAYFLILVGLLDRGYHILTKTFFEFDILAYAATFGFGIISAVIVRNEKRTIDVLKDTPKINHVMLYLIGGMVLVFGYFYTKNNYFSLAVPILTGVFFSYLVIEQTFAKHSIYKFRNAKGLSKIGKMTYGLFVYQSIISVITMIALDSLELDLTSIGTQLLFILLVIFMSYVVANFSYKYLERPVLSVKKEFKKS